MLSIILLLPYPQALQSCTDSVFVRYFSYLYVKYEARLKTGHREKRLCPKDQKVLFDQCKFDTLWFSKWVLDYFGDCRKSLLGRLS